MRWLVQYNESLDQFVPVQAPGPFGGFRSERGAAAQADILTRILKTNRNVFFSNE